MDSRLEYENGLVLDTLQAALGLISCEMRGLAVQSGPDGIVLHFAVRERTAEVDEDIEDIVFELDALRDGSRRIEAAVHLGAPDAAWPGRAGRLLYVAKETAEGS